MTRFPGNHDDPGTAQIDSEAAGWFARNRNSPDRATRKAFEAWMAHPAHARAYVEFEELWVDLAQLQQLSKPIALPQRRNPVWRPALAVAAAVLCTVLAVNLGTSRTPYVQQVAAQEQGHEPSSSPMAAPCTSTPIPRCKSTSAHNSAISTCNTASCTWRSPPTRSDRCGCTVARPRYGSLARPSMCAVANASWWSASPTGK